jgi:hypothetical protein
MAQVRITGLGLFTVTVVVGDPSCEKAQRAICERREVQGDQQEVQVRVRGRSAV